MGDCGVYAIKYVEFLSIVRQAELVNGFHMQKRRKKLAVELYTLDSSTSNFSQSTKITQFCCVAIERVDYGGIAADFFKFTRSRSQLLLNHQTVAWLFIVRKSYLKGTSLGSHAVELQPKTKTISTSKEINQIVLDSCT
ncbi:Uncharacterized protein Fot_24463 [Forsythia ovata]|uniref:Ubiquitin-like protease family profile domain-containing protein n=1 Tax=Forsythia ovata TaxID=205694 RepID=A0ABD1U6B4_9LAMI